MRRTIQLLLSWSGLLETVQMISEEKFSGCYWASPCLARPQGICQGLNFVADLLHVAGDGFASESPRIIFPWMPLKSRPKFDLLVIKSKEEEKEKSDEKIAEEIAEGVERRRKPKSCRLGSVLRPESFERTLCRYHLQMAFFLTPCFCFFDLTGNFLPRNGTSKHSMCRAGPKALPQRCRVAKRPESSWFCLIFVSILFLSDASDKWWAPHQPAGLVLVPFKKDGS